MRKSFSKFLGILLALCMIFSMCSFAAFSEGTETQSAAVTTYYAKFGGTGDGRSATAPAGSLVTLVGTINSDHPDGGNVTVRLIKHENEPTDGKLDSADECVFLDLQGIPSHKAVITYTSDGTEQSSIAFKNAWSASGSSSHAYISGPVVFDNVRLIDTRTDNASRDIITNGNDFSMINGSTIVLIPKKNSFAYSEWSNGHFRMGGYSKNAAEEGGTVILDGFSIIGDINFGGYGDTAGSDAYIYDNDVTLKSKNNSIKILYLSTKFSAGGADVFPVYNKNVNIVLDDCKVKSFLSNGNNSTGGVIKGALQIILNGESSIPSVPTVYSDDSRTVALSNIYKITSPEGVDFDVTETAGKYTVSGDKTAYIVSADGKTVNYSVDGVISVSAPGVYTALAEDSLDAIKASLDAPEGNSEFIGWDDSVSGVLTAKFAGSDDEEDDYEGESTPKYYVKWNGNGNGLSPETPVATVKDAIALINAAGYVAGDIVEIYIINDDTLTAEQTEGNESADPWMYDIDGNYLGNLATKGAKLKARQTAWAIDGGAAGTHTATLIIKGYTEDAKLFQSETVGYNTNITVGGPTVFENIAIVTTRNVDREIFTNGNEVTFNNVKFMYQVADNSAGSTKYGGLGNGHLRLTPSGSGNSGTIPGSTVILNTPIPNDSDKRYGLIIAGTKTFTYTTHTKYYLNSESENGPIGWAQAESTFNDGLSVVVNAGTYLPRVRTDATAKTVTVTGGLQVVFNNGTTPFVLPEDYVVADGIWYMISEDTDGNKLDVTDDAGTFKVIGGNTAWAVDEDGYSYASEGGYLTVPAGSYTVTYEESSATASGKLYLDGEEYAEFVPGTVVILPTLPNKPGTMFLGWGREGDIFASQYQTAKTDTKVYLTSQFEVYPDTCIYYVDEQNGSDDNDGKSEAKALKTLNAAITKADADTNTNKLVVIVGTFEIAKGDTAKRALAAHTNMVKIVGDGSGSSTIFKADTISINGPTTFEDIAFINGQNNKHIDALGHKLVIGKGVTFTAEGSLSKNFDIHSGKMNGNSTVRDDITISSPIYLLYVGTYYNSTPRSYIGGDFYINSTVGALALFADGWASGTSVYNLASVYDGVSNFYVNEGGNVANVVTHDTRAQYGEKTGFNFFLAGGKIAAIPEAVAPYAWIIDTKNFTETNYIKGTDVPGQFAVSGGLTALATHSSGAQYVSADGVLTLGMAGNYAIEFVDAVYYTNSGTKIEFYKDMQLDLSTAMHTEFDGKLFVGWTYENGEVPETNEFETGDILVASYKELDLSADFYIEGAQIRTSGVPGLRFIVRKSDKMEEILPEITGFGLVLIPSSALYEYSIRTQHELELGKTYNYNNKKYEAADVPAKKLYNKYSDGVSYTAVITGLTDEQYATMYTIKGYITYKDYNGIEKVLYSDYYATSYVNIADTAIRMSNSGQIPITEDQKTYFEGIIKIAKDYLALEFAGEVKTVAGSPDDENSYKHLYELGSSGVQVRDVNIYPSDYKEGETDREPLVIMQLSDIHFNYVSDEDFEEANPSVMSTYLGRTAFRTTVPAAQRTLRYAFSQTDNIVITGDVLDFISRGAMELTNKHIFDVYPYAMVALGNHDGTRVCQQPEDNKVPDPTTLESRIELVQQNWNGDNVYYDSRVIEDRVMVIYLDDGTASRFWDVQIEPLTRDLSIAREKGYTVLMFFHIPLRTGNPNETAVDQLPAPSGRSDNSGVRNFMTEGINPNANEATKQVYSLIRENGDIIGGIFTGHTHSPYYSEFVTETDPATGAVTAFIPQYIMTATAYSSGNATKIIVH